MVQPNSIFDHTLIQINMEPRSSGLRFTASMSQADDPDIYVGLEQASVYGATAVYFRFFSDDRPPRPQIYLFDHSDNFRIDRDQAKELHKSLWNAGVVPLMIIHSKTEIDVFNCLDIPFDASGVSYEPFDHFEVSANGLDALSKLYSASRFDSGLFWETQRGKQFDYNKSAYEQLLKALSRVKNRLIRENAEVDPVLIKRVLVMLILIKYLEDRKDEFGNSALNPKEFYSEYAGEYDSSLAGVLRNGRGCLRMFDKLASPDHFNGEVFKLNDAEKEEVERIDMELFALFVEGNITFSEEKSPLYGQLSLWKLYSFNHLPIELISHIYEDFLSGNAIVNKKGVVYTPPYLVQFLIDRIIPIDHAPNTPQYPKVLDPACGSGIFLVGVFKRYIQRWRKANNWKRPASDDVPSLLDILSSSIYGCDIISEAVRLSYFGLSLALLDSLSPKEIWGNVHFENLIGKNLIAGDFFLAIKQGRIPENLDLVIGNPPFESSLTDAARSVELKEIEKSQRPKLPDNQIALLFLEQSIMQLRKGGKCCLLLPSGPLLYNKNSTEFRNYLIKKFAFRTVWDFTSLRTKLFKSSSSSAKPSVLALSVENREIESNSVYHIDHVVMRLTQASGEKIEFETDYYDVHSVSLEDAIKNAKVWQTNLMGGGRLHYLMQKLVMNPSLGDYLQKKVEQGDWVIGEGWIEAKSSIDPRLFELDSKENLDEAETAELELLREKYSAPWITGKNCVNTRQFSERGIGEVETCEKKYFYRSAKKNKEIFAPPHLLIKESARNNVIPVEYRTDYLTFRDKIIGIHSPGRDVEDLKSVARYLKQKTAFSLVWLFSGQIIGSREGVPLKGDIFSIPYFEDGFILSENESILLEDVAEYMADFRKKGEKSIALDPIDGKEKVVLSDFGDTYCKILNSVYKDFKAAEPVIDRDFICFPFYFGDRPILENPSTLSSVEMLISGLLNYRDQHNLWIRRVLRVYEQNMIFLYKPNQKRYWLRSVAMRDADDTFSDLLEQGY